MIKPEESTADREGEKQGEDTEHSLQQIGSTAKEPPGDSREEENEDKPPPGEPSVRKADNNDYITTLCNSYI